ncbi:MAG: hypothetical protein LBQ44_10740 [Treponema sp.]|jgi:hypothetical protein|nr:hypothetical protein [Treponema sp.]
MEKITINGDPADITLETEKTVGELLSGIDAWLSGSGVFISGLELDGKNYGAPAMDDAFKLSLDEVGYVNVKTSGWAELFIEALAALKGEAPYIEKAQAEERRLFLSEWEESPACAFLEKNAPEIRSAFVQFLSGSLTHQAFVSLIDERLGELCDPGTEMKGIVPLCGEIATRLENLPLDMQTGKDGRAAETIVLFSAMAEKIFRLFLLAKYYGFDAGDFKELIEDFGAAVKELLAAYENKDTVLMGDLAEYELAPRLLNLSKVLYDFSLSQEILLSRKEG